MKANFLKSVEESHNRLATAVETKVGNVLISMNLTLSSQADIRDKLLKQGLSRKNITPKKSFRIKTGDAIPRIGRARIPSSSSSEEVEEE